MNLSITILLICLKAPNVSAGKTIKQFSVLISEPAGAFLAVFLMWIKCEGFFLCWLDVRMW